ncbi:uncharacterized protein A1O9_10359 [Exophiala aquamarina CBS 119918]|uniref:Major facilitator superfamily (MFS) profile domain-containing protein n=1 Tax=Exophiala aquamarina CBS 119918 TaxID=1182545 RepID=A0A072NZV0_9EURO|nr:uncharacterized protein A1O9_10359 [Exophiala aquamarina CBS 119918]KEF53384.1 hypothetical protein A1O9_10359 [Exophiala aquamarina CBS 119918]
MKNGQLSNNRIVSYDLFPLLLCSGSSTKNHRLQRHRGPHPLRAGLRDPLLFAAKQIRRSRPHDLQFAQHRQQRHQALHAWARGAKTGFFFAGTCTLSLVFTAFCIPETKGRTYAEVTVLFQSGVKAWKFRSENVDLTRTKEDEEQGSRLEGKPLDW